MVDLVAARQGFLSFDSPCLGAAGGWLRVSRCSEVESLGAAGTYP